MPRRSKFESQLNFRQLGFAFKIPDVGYGRKPFDYVAAIQARCGDEFILKFLAIEAKTACGWSLPKSAWLPHQRVALDTISRMSAESAWVAIGFLDIPKMKLDYAGNRITSKLEKRAFLICWRDFLSIEGDSSCKFESIINEFGYSEMVWGKYDDRYCWMIPANHHLFKTKF